MINAKTLGRVLIEKDEAEKARQQIADRLYWDPDYVEEPAKNNDTVSNTVEEKKETKSNMATKSLHQEKLLRLFKKHNNRMVFLTDGEDRYRWFWKRAKKSGHTYEVKELLERDARHRALKEIMDSIGSKNYSSSEIKSLYDYIIISSGVFTKQTVSYVAKKSEGPDPLYTFVITPDIVGSNTRDQIPAWNQWLDRISDPEAFAAWIWSVYEPEHRGRQLLYLVGSGEDGKSTIDRVFQRNFGNRYCFSATNTEIFSASNSHGTSALVGKRYISLPDISNPNILKYSKMKAILGGDPVTIEPKFMSIFSTVINARIFAAANSPLSLSSKLWEISRLLLIDVSPTKHKNIKWEYELDEEFDKFIKYAKWCYERRCPDHYEIRSEKSDDSKKSLSMESNEDVMATLESVFSFDEDPASPTKSITRSEFTQLLKSNRIASKTSEIKKLKEFLFDLGFKDFGNSNGHKVKLKSGKVVRVYRGIGPRDYTEDIAINTFISQQPED